MGECSNIIIKSYRIAQDEDINLKLEMGGRKVFLANTWVGSPWHTQPPLKVTVTWPWLSCLSWPLGMLWDIFGWVLSTPIWPSFYLERLESWKWPFQGFLAATALLENWTPPDSCPCMRFGRQTWGSGCGDAYESTPRDLSVATWPPGSSFMGWGSWGHSSGHLSNSRSSSLFPGCYQWFDLETKIHWQPPDFSCSNFIMKYLEWFLCLALNPEK